MPTPTQSVTLYMEMVGAGPLGEPRFLPYLLIAHFSPREQVHPGGGDDPSSTALGMERPSIQSRD